MLDKLEMHDIQDKTRLLDEMNETREAVNAVQRRVEMALAIIKDPMRPQKEPKKKGK